MIVAVAILNWQKAHWRDKDGSRPDCGRQCWKCQVKECIYNDHDDEICELEAIKIGPDGLGDTDCMSFESSKRKDYK